MDRPNLFLDNLVAYGGAKTIDRAADYQSEIVEAVRRTGKKGSLTIKMDFVRKGQSEVIVDVNVVPKIPQAGFDRVVMFSDEKNRLFEENPQQMTTHAKVVSIDAPKTVNK